MRWGQGRLGQEWLAHLAILGLGAFAALGFAPLHIWPATGLALAGFYMRVRQVSAWDRPGRSGFATGLLFGLGWFSASCFWIASAFIERGESFLLLIPPLVGGLAIVLSLFWGLAAAISARIMKTRAAWVGPLIFTATLMLAELARGHLFSGFPWNLPAYAFVPGGWASQSAWWIGVYGLSMAFIAAAALFGHALMERRGRAVWRPAAVSLLIFAMLFGYGGFRIAKAPEPGQSDIQPGVLLRLVNVPFRQSDKLDPEKSFAIIDRFLAESVQPGVADVTHVIWPEGAVNGLAIDDYLLLRVMGRNLAQVDDTPPVWLMNSLRLEISPDPRTGESRPRYYNSSVAVTFDAAGNPAIAGTDDKKKLVPFGEFIPGGEIVETLGARLVSTALGSLTGAEEKRVTRFPGLPPLSAQICYEVIFPGLTPRGDVAPEVILNQSNDAWFGATMGPAQHAAIARYRTIEEGVPMIRSAANGVSGIIDPYGRLVAQTSRKRVSHIDATLPKALKKQSSTRQANFFVVLLNFAFLVISMAIGRIR